MKRQEPWGWEVPGTRLGLEKIWIEPWKVEGSTPSPPETMFTDPPKPGIRQ